MSKPYKICPHCGDHLDAGERCTCKDADTRGSTPESGDEAGQRATANPHEPVLVPGA